MTESQIERRFERMVDALDRQLMRGEISWNDYRSEYEAACKWADARYAENAR